MEVQQPLQVVAWLIAIMEVLVQIVLDSEAEVEHKQPVGWEGHRGLEHHQEVFQVF